MIKIETSQPISEFDTAILRYMQLSIMTQQQYGKHLAAKSFKVIYEYFEDILNDVFFYKKRVRRYIIAFDTIRLRPVKKT